MRVQALPSGLNGVVVADHGPGMVVLLLLLPIGYGLGAAATLRLLTVVHGSSQGLLWVAGIAGWPSAAMTYLLVVRVIDWLNAQGRDRPRPRAEIDSEGVVIVSGRGDRTRARWDDVVRMVYRDGATWLMGPADERLAEVPARVVVSKPGFAYTGVTARPDRFALSEDGRAFVLREEATTALDPERWLFDQRWKTWLDLGVLGVSGSLVLGLVSEQAAQPALYAWLVWAVVWSLLSGRTWTLIRRYVGPGGRGMAR